MNELLGRITNLSYEIFGVFAPGVVLILFGLDIWFALGDLAPALTINAIPLLELNKIESYNFSWIDISVLVTSSYFLGHLLVWISRKCGKEQHSFWKRVGCCLIFRIPRVGTSYDPELESLLNACAVKFNLPVDKDTWRRFYPLAKIMLSETLSRSLVATYQNKYTLHRSITAAAVLLFWACIICIGYGICHDQLNPRWHVLIGSLVFSVVIIWGFSDSFNYYWRMFGNSIITESYAVLSRKVKL